MDDGALFRRMQASLRAFYRVVAAGSNESQLLERDGLTAAVVPAAPDRSVFNGVVYERGEALADQLDELARTYDAAGVRAWTVWVPARDADSTALLERAGHRLDAEPAAMALELENFDGRRSDGVELEPDPDTGKLARINDAAYGYGGDFARALGGLPSSVHLYVARVNGEPAACTAAFDHNRDCCITFVATLPEARGRGLATDLMTRALLEARDRGCTTTTLQATKMGRPVYERMGYRNLGPLQMWERRKASGRTRI
jgi:GNAT superfamily N-acetyltransferase